MMETVRTSEKSVYSNETTRRYIPDGFIIILMLFSHRLSRSIYYLMCLFSVHCSADLTFLEERNSWNSSLSSLLHCFRIFSVAYIFSSDITSYSRHTHPYMVCRTVLIFIFDLAIHNHFTRVHICITMSEAICRLRLIFCSITVTSQYRKVLRVLEHWSRWFESNSRHICLSRSFSVEFSHVVWDPTIRPTPLRNTLRNI
jgi:hypothetical protein